MTSPIVAALSSPARRLVAPAIAIMVATAFLAAGLIGSATARRGVENVAAQAYTGADLVVAKSLDGVSSFTVSTVNTFGVSFPATAASSNGPVTDYMSHDEVRDWVDAIARVPAVATVAPIETVNVTLDTGNQAEYVTGQTIGPVTASLMTDRMAHGALPTAADQIAVEIDLAERLDLEVGSTVELRWQTWLADDGEETPDRPVIWSRPATVTALYGDWRMSLGTELPQIAVPPQFVDQYAATSAGQPYVDKILVTLADDADPVQAAAAIRAAAGPLAKRTSQNTMSGSVLVSSVREVAGRDASGFLSAIGIYAVLVLTLTMVSLAVAALVVSNIFQVLVAQRTRVLALLRCAGATTGQVRRAVLAQGAIVGTVGSLAGWAAGGGLIHLAVIKAALDYPLVPMPGAPVLTWWGVAVPLGAGIGITVIAAAVPARLATTVSPLAALQPARQPSLRHRPGRSRLICSLVAAIGGALVLAGAISAPTLAQRTGLAVGTTEEMTRLLVPVGVLAGALSAGGILLGAVFWVPRVVHALARLVSRAGPGARIAATNTVRNPHRTAAAATALIVAVALVAGISTTVASLKATFLGEVSDTLPVDIQVGAVPWFEVWDSDSTQGGAAAGQLVAEDPASVGSDNAADDGFLTAGEVPDDGKAPEDSSVPDDGEAPEDSSVPDDGMVPDDGNVPDDGEATSGNLPDDAHADTEAGVAVEAAEAAAGGLSGDGGGTGKVIYWADGVTGRLADQTLGDPWATTPISPELLTELGGTSGLDAVVPVATGRVTVPTGLATADFMLAGVDVASVRASVRSDAFLAGLTPGSVLVAVNVADGLNLGDGERLSVTGPAGSATLTVIVAPEAAQAPLMVDQTDFAAIVGLGEVTAAWLAVAPQWADSAVGVDLVRAAVSAHPGADGIVQAVSGTVVVRAQLRQVLDTTAIVAMGLLSVAIIIAVIGIANTLSLSIWERRRESALLRALGLTRGQMRWMLAVEGATISGLGAAIGVVLGVGFGWAAALLIASASRFARIAVDPAQLAGVVVVALVAGLAASILPGRTAAKALPAAALAEQ